jgi:hypothetical protein
MTVSVILPETGRHYVYTGFIAPGETRETVKLHIPLEKGVYEGLAEITAYDSATFTVRGSELSDITLHVG